MHCINIVDGFIKFNIKYNYLYNVFCVLKYTVYNISFACFYTSYHLINCPLYSNASALNKDSDSVVQSLHNSSQPELH